MDTKNSEVSTDEKKIQELLTRGVEDVFVRESLENKLRSGVQLRVKLGIDPTGPAIHLGRAIPLRKLKAFQDLGHKIVLIIGDFTAKIADPSDKLEKRPMLSDGDIQKNLLGYLEQIGKIIDLSHTEIHYNSEWLAKMNILEISQLLDCFTVQQMSKRRNFHERLELGQDIFIVEFMYPALQGFDSYKIAADVEIGGFDQLFNLKAGRTVQKRYGQKEQDIMVLSMLEGTDGRKMSSSWGNIISLVDTKEDMYGKIMSVRDDLMYNYFSLTTELSIKEIEEIMTELEQKNNFREVKAKLAREIVALYHGKDDAQKAEENFNTTFSDGGIPDEAMEVEGVGKSLIDVALESGLVESKGEFRRLIESGAVTHMNTGEKVTDTQVQAQTGVYKIGKRRFVKIK